MRKLMLATASLWAVALLGAAPSHAHFQTYPYTLNGCPADYSRQVDPITNVFYGQGWAYRAANHIAYHADWPHESGSNQFFSSHGVCGEMVEQRASGPNASSRYHIRLRKTYDEDATWGITSRGDAHHEDLVWYCGHAVDEGGVTNPDSNWSGFDMGRYRIYLMFLGTHHTWGGNTYWGNTRQFRQCDGDYAGSNGNVHWWRVPDWSH